MERPRNLELWRDRETKNQRDRETEKQRNREPEIKKETSRHKVTKKQKRKTHRTAALHNLGTVLCRNKEKKRNRETKIKKNIDTE